MIHIHNFGASFVSKYYDEYFVKKSRNGRSQISYGVGRVKIAKFGNKERQNSQTKKRVTYKDTEDISGNVIAVDF